jgi:hypothetical protein
MFNCTAQPCLCAPENRACRHFTGEPAPPLPWCRPTTASQQSQSRTAISQIPLQMLPVFGSPRHSGELVTHLDGHDRRFAPLSLQRSPQAPGNARFPWIKSRGKTGPFQFRQPAGHPMPACLMDYCCHTFQKHSYSHSIISKHHSPLNPSRNISSDGANPTASPSQFSAFDFKGRIARLKFLAASTTIAISRSISATRSSNAQWLVKRKRTVTAYRAGC